MWEAIAGGGRLASDHAFADDSEGLHKLVQSPGVVIFADWCR
jgi:hypothetical protein